MQVQSLVEKLLTSDVDLGEYEIRTNFSSENESTEAGIFTLAFNDVLVDHENKIVYLI